MQPVESRPSAVLMRLVNGYRVSQAIHVAAVLGIADLLKDRPCGSDEIAAAAGANPESLYRLLRALASIGVFREADDRRFALTPLGDCLRSDAPEPIGPWARFVGCPSNREAWGDLLHSVRTGETAFRHLHSMGVWEYRAQHPEDGAMFDAAMTANSRRLALSVLAAYDFGRFGRIVDVGGGQGAFLAAILIKHLATVGVLIDQPHVVAQAGPVLRGAGVADRCRIVGGDIFDAVPGGGDAYVLKVILHDWDDERAIAILRTCRRAVGPTGRLLVVDRVVGPPNEDEEGKFLDLHMLAETGGRERTRDEWASLLAQAGFHLAEVVATKGPMCVIEGTPA